MSSSNTSFSVKSSHKFVKPSARIEESNSNMTSNVSGSTSSSSVASSSTPSVTKSYKSQGNVGLSIKNTTTAVEDYY